MTALTAAPRTVGDIALSSQPMVGGSLSLDLMNTIWQQDGGRFDWLGDDAAVVDFAERNGEPTARADVKATRRALVSTRELIARILASPDDAAPWITDVDRALRATVVSFDADALAIRITGTPAADEVAMAALLDALDLVGTRPERVRSCDHEACTLWFLDTSKAGRRRWCSMETCGNRAKARRHQSKTKGAST